MTKAKAAETAALSLLGVGTREQGTRMPTWAPEDTRVKPRQMNIQLTPEGLAMLQEAQVKCLQKGVCRASFRGVVLEVVLKEWLEAQ